MTDYDLTFDYCITVTCIDGFKKSFSNSKSLSYISEFDHTIQCLFLSISVVVAVVSVAVLAPASVAGRRCPAWTTNRNYQPWDWPLDLWAPEGFVEIEGLVARISIFVGYYVRIRTCHDFAPHVCFTINHHLRPISWLIFKREFPEHSCKKISVPRGDSWMGLDCNWHTHNKLLAHA